MSKVINGKYGVSAATQARVRAVIEEIGYEASLGARSLRNRRTNVIGILVSDIEPFSAELLKGAAEAIHGTGYELVIYSAGGRADDRVGWERRYLSRLCGTLIDGAVLVTPTVVDLNQQAPVVAVDPRSGPSSLPTVDSDNLRGARLATEHLIALGHRRIAMLTGRPDLRSSHQREQGFRRAMVQSGLGIDDAMLRVGAYDPEVAADATRELLSAEHRPTAIFAANDQSAIAALAVASELDLRVPGDLSVIGFDNIPDSALCAPPLTTIDQQIGEMGRRAINLLTQLLRGDAVDQTHVTLATTLVMRGSTGRPDPAPPA